ncbi:uncharacterized protein FIBRA_09186 [Fibroporia radiculosa]|uniref:Cytidyltransferase-like domain-containing protein n=1 Tax=Fibroporia radiculosa TaxID=599839 RepID=J7SCT1_9APHY|nr:uncharacterized protein FIBRA_09186 [Fibroporia radiculosa]CCM06878.1 predicted protein [Fibroporia radiculosa]
MHHDQPDSVPRSVLFATIHHLHEPPLFLSAAIATATRNSTDSLRIVLYSHFFNDLHNPPPDEVDNTGPVSHTEYWDEVQRLLTYVYVQATQVAQDTGRVLMDIDVLLKGSQGHPPEDFVRDTQRIYLVPHPHPAPPHLASIQHRPDVVLLPPSEHTRLSHVPPHSSRTRLPPLYPVVAMGGTFDHLHAGHKILLSMAAWIASERLIVGITDDVLLKNKANKEVLEDLPARTARTRAFLERFKPGLFHDIVPITDVYGPTAWDPDVQALVVSKETLPGASSIHAHRKDKGLPPLETFVIDVISATEASIDDADAERLKSAKMSSTYIRQWIVDHQARPEKIPA